jgi:hypothetical protein
MRPNGSAQHFWVGAIPMFAGEVIQPVRIEKGGQCWNVFWFESKRVA